MSCKIKNNFFIMVNQLDSIRQKRIIWGVFLFVSIGIAVVLVATSMFHLPQVSVDTNPPSVFSAQDASFFLDPDSSTQDPDSQFTINAKVDPKSDSIAAVVLNISFDPSVLQLDAVDTTDSPFSNVLIPASIDNNRGIASITSGVVASDPPAPVTGVALVAALKFHAVGMSEEGTPIVIEDTSQAAAIGESGNVIRLYVPASVRISKDTTPPDDGAIFEDDFESALSWQTSGSVTLYDGDPKNGAHAVQLEDDGSSMEKTISLSGYKKVTVSFSMGGVDLDNDKDYIQALYYDGSSWRTLETIEGGSTNADGKLHAFTIPLPSFMNGHEDFALRFQMSGKGKKDYGYVDDVMVDGDPL